MQSNRPSENFRLFGGGVSKDPSSDVSVVLAMFSLAFGVFAASFKRFGSGFVLILGLMRLNPSRRGVC